MTGDPVVAAIRLEERRRNLEARALLGPAAAVALAYGVKLSELLGGVALWRRDDDARRVHDARRALWRHMRNDRAMSWGEMAQLLGVSRATLIRRCRRETADVQRHKPA
jgi:hypothetical protein